MTTAVRAHVRWAIRRDLPEVLAIEAESFDPPWSEQDYLEALRRRNCIGMVAEVGEAVAGFMVYELHKHRLEVLRLAVAPRWRRLGVGTLLLDRLKGKLTSHRRRWLALGVPETLLAAQLFLKRRGFLAVNVLLGQPDLFRMTYCVGSGVSLGG